MELLLVDDGEPLRTLRKQYDAASVNKRFLTGAGFFLCFSVPDTCARLPNGTSAAFGDVVATIEGLPFGAGFVLHIKQ